MIDWYFRALNDLPLPVVVAIVGVFGSLVGSFVNVCILRIPKGESIVVNRSHCPTCKHELGVLDLLPVLSYLALRGRCRYCGAGFSGRYAMVELFVAMLWAIPFLLFGLTWTFPILSTLLTTLVAVTGILLVKRGQISDTGATGDGDEPRAPGRGGQMEGQGGPSADAGFEAQAKFVVASPRPAGGNRGLSFLEILFTTIILVSVIGPFLSIMRSSYMGAEKNREHIIAYNLASEKLEELKVLPIEKLKSDWKVYVKGKLLTDNIFVDEFFGKFAKMDEDEEFFYGEMTDVCTENRPFFTETVFAKFKRNYRRYHGFAYKVYPNGYGKFFRTTKVKRIVNKDNPSRPLVKVTVTVVIRSLITKGKTVQLATFLSGD